MFLNQFKINIFIFIFNIFSIFNVFSTNFNYFDSIIIATFIQQDKKAEMNDYYKNRKNFFMLLSDKFDKDNSFNFQLINQNDSKTINVGLNFKEIYYNPTTKINEIKEKIYFKDLKGNITEIDLKDFTVVVFKVKLLDNSEKYIICNDCNSFEKIVNDSENKEYIGLFQNFKDIKEISVEYISNNKSKWNIGRNLFFNFKNLEKIDFKNHEYNFINISLMFANCENLIKIDNIKSIFEKSENITNCGSLFCCCENLEFDNIGFKNIKLPKNFDIFNFSLFKKIDLSSCDFSNVEKISFRSCQNLEEININITTNTSNLKDLKKTFFYCTNLKKIDLSKINVENVKTFGEIFCYCTELEEVNLTGWKFNEEADYINFFADCVNLKKIIGLKNIIVKKNLIFINGKEEINCGNFFYNNKNLETLDLSTLKIEDCNERFIEKCNIKTIILPNDKNSALKLINNCLNCKENQNIIKNIKYNEHELKDINDYDDLLRFISDSKDYLDNRNKITEEIKQKYLESLKNQNINNQDVKNIENIGFCSKCFSNCCCCCKRNV